MPARKLKLVKELPLFVIPEKYKCDEWDVKAWDIYGNAPSAIKSAWDFHSDATGNAIRFSLCNNLYIAEEYKYFMYHLIEVKKIALSTLIKYYDLYKVLARYVNANMADSQSILELEDSALLRAYLLSIGKDSTNDGDSVLFTAKGFTSKDKNERFLIFLTDSQAVIKAYYEKDMPETKKLVWYSENLPFCKKSCANKHLDFNGIKDPVMLKNVQDFCLQKLYAIAFNSVYAYLFDIKLFLGWLDKNHPLEDLDRLDRGILEKYFTWLRTASGYNSNKANVAILNLKVFFDWGQLLEREHMPKNQLILNSDYMLKTKKESRYLTDEEVKSLLNVLPQMPKLYGRMVYCLLFLGMRFSELARLDVNAIKKNDDGTYYLDLWQYKTQAVNEKPVFENTLKIMAAEIERNKKRFGEDNVKYVFVNDKNEPVSVETINRHIKNVLTKNNVLGRDGKILHITTHRFRATVATNLISEGVNVDVAAQLLGQTTLSSLSHYATVTNDVVKEQLKPRLEKDEMLIRNIGKGKNMAEVIPEKSVALCNGYCGKNPLTTPCAKANACFNCSMFIPSIQFLNAYHIQLLEIEATIKVAEANNYDMMLKKALREKEALEKIISKLEKGDRENDG